MTGVEEPVSDAAAWVWGDRRLWIDETLNDMLALSDRYVAAVGHSHIFVWRRVDGTEVRRFRKFLRPEHGWFADERGELCLRAGERVVVCTLASGAVDERAPGPEDPPLPTVTFDRSAYTVTLRWPEGHTQTFAYPNELMHRVSCAHTGGRIAVTHGMTRIDIRDAVDGAVLRTLVGAGDGVLAPDGRTIAVGGLSGQRVHIAEVDAWTPSRTDVPHRPVEALRCSPDGARLLVLAGDGGWILRADDGAPQVRLAGEHVDPRTTWTADGTALVGPAGDRVVRWDAASGAATRYFELRPRTKAASFAVDADGLRVAIVGETYPGGLMLVPGEEAVVHDLAQGTVIARVRLEDVYDTGVELSADGRRLALVHADGVRVVTLPARAGDPLAVDRRMPGTWVGFLDDGVRLHELTEETGRVIRLRDGQVVGEMAVGSIAAFTATADGRWLATATHDGIITVRTGEDFAVCCTLRAIDRATVLAISPDGRMLFAGGWDATVHAFRLPEARPGPPE